MIAPEIRSTWRPARWWFQESPGGTRYFVALEAVNVLTGKVCRNTIRLKTPVNSQTIARACDDLLTLMKELPA